MKSRSKEGPGPAKARRRKTATRKRSNSAKAAGHRRSSAAAGQETKVARLTRELNEALEQHAATSEVLQVISNSPGNLELVFETILEKAVRICDANFGYIYRWRGDALNVVAAYNLPPAFAEARRGPIPLNPRWPIGRMLATRTTVHVADCAAEPLYTEERDPAWVEGVELGGIRTLLAVPMLKENELIGAFIIYRQEVRSFTDQQIALVSNFAAQAVIAIENTRLLNELRQRTDDLTERTANRVAAAADRYRRRAEGHQPVSFQPHDGAYYIGRIGGAALRG
jgi:GAF domain-containing protein